MSKLVARLAFPRSTVLALAGCGSSSSSTTSSTDDHRSHRCRSQRRRRDRRPGAGRDQIQGHAHRGRRSHVRPNEFIASDGHTVIGMDADLMKALGAVMGLKVNIVNATFDTIIPGLAAGKYDIGASSFTDTKEREKTVDFVDYFTAGISFYAKSSSNPGVKTVADLCGKTVSVEKGTTEEEEADAAGQEVHQSRQEVRHRAQSSPTQNEANLAISSGRAELGMADSPVAAYQVKQSSGRLQARRRNLRLRALRAGDSQEQRHDHADAGGAEAADRKRHLHADPHQMGRPVGRDHDAGDQRSEELEHVAGVLSRGHRWRRGGPRTYGPSPSGARGAGSRRRSSS